MQCKRLRVHVPSQSTGKKYLVGVVSISLGRGRTSHSMGDILPVSLERGVTALGVEALKPVILTLVLPWCFSDKGVVPDKINMIYSKLIHFSFWISFNFLYQIQNCLSIMESNDKQTLGYWRHLLTTHYLSQGIAQLLILYAITFQRFHVVHRLSMAILQFVHNPDHRWLAANLQLWRVQLKNKTSELVHG